jgi:hypothetical protein
VRGAALPDEPTDGDPCLGATTSEVPFQRTVNCPSPLGQACRYGPGAVVDVAHAMPAGGEDTLSAS